MGRLVLALVLLPLMGLPRVASAGAFDNSLWLGTDNTAALPVLNTDRAGNELRRVDLTEATGIAIDPVTNRIYFGVSGGQVTGRSLTDPATILVTFNPTTIFGEDMAFDGTSLWRADISASLVKKIDPSDGAVLFSFDPGFYPLGVAWDGNRLWVSEYTVDGLVKQFDSAGVPTGNQFQAPLGGKEAGGLAFDPTDGTLWIGTFDQVVHCTTAGTSLGSFNAPGRFIDGLEFQGVTSRVDVPGDPRGSRASLSLSANPNPFATGVNLEVQVSGEAVVTLDVFDLRGARIIRLADELVGPGRHLYRWDARDAGGKRQPAGVYWVRAAVGGRHTMRPVVVIN